MKQINKHLVIGIGEIGTAIAKIFNADGIDKGQIADQKSYKYLHICIPYSDKFEQIVDEYQQLYSPDYTIIHSTVKVGTSRHCGAIHSPIIGIHPFLEEGIRTFVKYLGGEGNSEVADEFRRHGLKVYLFDDSETTELMKILDTTFYGVCLEYTKDVKRQCKKIDVPFEAWTVYTENYNKGYQKLGYPEYTRPNLIPIMKRTGGHCVLQNTELLETHFTNLVKKLNE